MDKNPKHVVENIKHEAKEYYKWKNMTPRYIIIWFLVVLLALQFFLPRQDKRWTDIDLYIDVLENTWQQRAFTFLNIDIDISGFEYELDLSMAQILDNKYNLKVLYEQTFLTLLDLEKELVKQSIPRDFKYLIFLSDMDQKILPLNQEIVEKYNLKKDAHIDDSKNFVLAKNVGMEYLKFLYKEFQDWELVLSAYLMWSDNLKSIMMEQWKTEFKDLYIDWEFVSQYIKMIVYKDVIENIGKYLNVSTLKPYKSLDTKIVKVGEIKDIVKRSQKEWYNFKEIKTLNPWILGNSLPKGRWELVVVR